MSAGSLLKSSRASTSLAKEKPTAHLDSVPRTSSTQRPASCYKSVKRRYCGRRTDTRNKNSTELAISEDRELRPSLKPSDGFDEVADATSLTTAIATSFHFQVAHRKLRP